LIIGCKTKKEFTKAQKSNTVEAYEDYLKEFSEGKYSQEATLQLGELRQQNAWGKATADHSIKSYQVYLENYPQGKYVKDAKDEIKKLEEERDWQEALKSNSIDVFESFIEKYSGSENLSTAKNNLHELKLGFAWENANSSESIDELLLFRSNFPESKYDEESGNRIQFLEIYKSDWEKTLENPTIESLNSFLKKYPDMSYSDIARVRLTEIDEQTWDSALKDYNIDTYRQYQALLPEGIYAEEAEKKIIDLEVEAVFGGKYGSMPAMDRSYSADNMTTNEIEVYNNTSYMLTILYSGPESKRIIIQPKQRSNYELPIGKYKVAASVSASNIGNFAGTEKLEGGSYSVEYYIYTTYH